MVSEYAPVVVAILTYRGYAAVRLAVCSEGFSGCLAATEVSQ